MKVTTNTFYVAFGMCCALSVHLLAQPENLHFEHLSELNGLSQNSVWSILQDREGFMWFGTQDGLNKYDGYTFTVFRPDPDDPEHTLHHNIINDIYEDKKGRLWVTTIGGGLHEVDKTTGKVTHYGNQLASTKLWNILGLIHEDQEGILWIGALGGVARFDPETHQFVLYAGPLERFGVATVTEDANHQLWVGGRGGVYQLDRSTGKFTPVVLDTALIHQPVCWSLYLDKEGILWAGTDGEGLFRLDTDQHPLHFTRYNPGGLVNQTFRYSRRSIYEDAQGYLWLPTLEGLQRIDRRADQVLNFQADPFQPSSLGHQNVSAVYQDRAGTLWIGTDNGINKVIVHAKKFHTCQIVPALPSVVVDQNDIGTLLEDHTGKIWVGSAGFSVLLGDFQNGLFQFNPETQQFKHFPANPSQGDHLSSNRVLSLYEDQKKRLWVGTEEALYLRNDRTGKFSRYPSGIPVENIDEDPSGKLWIGAWGDKGIASFDPGEHQFRYYKYNPNDTAGLKDGSVWDILATRSGDIWVAHIGAGIARLDQHKGAFIFYLPDPVAPEGHLNDKDVRALYEDAEGVIWAGTNQGGLNRFDTVTNTFTYFTMQDGLPSNHIVSIIDDKSGNLWLGTNKGISCFDPKTKTFRNYDVSDGLPANEFRKGSVYSRNGKLMFGCVNGFVIFHPDSIQDNTTIPPVYITGFKVMEKPREVSTDNNILPYHENFLSFDFVALNYNAPEKNQYAYQLEGIDKDWVYSGTRRFASYTDLDPGKYTFRVKGTNNDRLWNEEGASLQVTILSPWWQTGWTYGLYGLLALSFLYGLRQYTVRQERLKHALKLQILEAEKMHEMDHLKSRFFANLSHEFRTPLSLIRGTIEKLRRKEDTASEIHSDYKIIDRSAGKLLQMINQMLDVSRLEAGKLALHPQPDNISALLRALASAFTSLFESRGITYQYTVPLQTIWVLADSEKLEQIVNNLLSNAAKFTPAQGVVNFTATFENINDEVGSLYMRIQDTGIGISADHLPHIFDRFFQTDNSATRNYEGTGIGLALVKELVDLHGGQVVAESTEGKGSTFTVQMSFPLTDAREVETIEQKPEIEGLSPAMAITAEKDKRQKPANKRGFNTNILVVEDNTDLRYFIADYLSESHVVQEAENGMEGYRLAAETIPDLIISDIMMPGLDGISLCRKLKEDERTSHIPMILLTAKVDDESKINGLETGADDYLTKPFSAEELLLRVSNLIRQRQQLRQKFSKSITLQPAALAVTSTDERFLQKIMLIMEENMSNADFDVNAFSRAIGMSRAQLNRKLSGLADLSPNELIRTTRLKRAAQLLLQNPGNVSEIAFMVGFSSANYFTKCFRDYYGVAPSVYQPSKLVTEERPS